jgi:UDP-N-acetyl-D-mannosaminuronate dehydrogenase
MTTGRHCAICGKIGGTGLSQALRLLQGQAKVLGVELNWHSLETIDGKAHGPCVIKEKARLYRIAVTKKFKET